MAVKAIEMTGRVFGHLRVIDRAPPTGQNVAYWNCECANCGRVVAVNGTKLRAGLSRSCGCVRNSGAFAAKKHAVPEPKQVVGARWIPLTKGAFALVDEADFDRISKFNWCLAVRGYAVRRESKRVIYMHQAIVGANVDHRNRNKLDNRRYNLRPASSLENTRNRGAQLVGRNPTGIRTSVFKGVCWSKRKKMWRTTINSGGKQKNLGHYHNQIQAAAAYNVAAAHYFGEFVVFNRMD